MQFTIAALSALALGSTAFAQTSVSKPFNLTVTTADGKYYGAGLAACHVGAGIETLCTDGFSTFNLNTTEGQQPQVPGDGVPGVLTWTLPSEPIQENEGMAFSVDVSTNVGMPMFGFGNEFTYVAFDENDEMNVQSAYDDTVSPPKDDQSTRALYNWYICLSSFESYTYNNLAWVYGNAAPQNPSCSKATVKRVFI